MGGFSVIELRCSACSSLLRVDGPVAGRHVRCPKCGYLTFCPPHRLRKPGRPVQWTTIAGVLCSIGLAFILGRLKVGLHVWCHGLRHTSITQAAELRQRAGLGLDKIRAHSRHRSIATLMIYVDEHDRQQTQATLADPVAGTLSAAGK
jgi:DNA-directed RNA polymerase subunit RPC12/RpoP